MPHLRSEPVSGTLYRVDKTIPMLVHLCGARSWTLARQCGELPVESDTGFIHLSTPEQVHLPANRLYRGRRDLVLLYVNAGRLRSPLRWEPGTEADPEGMEFPHLYGPLPVSAVVDVVGYRAGIDGAFAPASISRPETPDGSG